MKKLVFIACFMSVISFIACGSKETTAEPVSENDTVVVDSLDSIAVDSIDSII